MGAALTAYYHSIVDTLREQGIDVEVVRDPTFEDILRLREFLQEREEKRRMNTNGNLFDMIDIELSSN